MAVSFSGSTDKITLPTTPSALDDLANSTVCQWGYWTDPSATPNSRSYGKGLGAAFHGIDWDTANLIGTYGRVASAQSVAARTNFAAFGKNKWLFFAMISDTTTGGNNTLWMGDQSTLAAQPSGYVSQTAGSGAHTTNAAASPTIGNRTADGRQWIGSIAWTAVFPVQLTQKQLWEVQANPFAINSPALNLISWSTTMLVDYSGNKFNGTITGSANAAHVPAKPIFGYDQYGQNYVSAAGGGPLVFGGPIAKGSLIRGGRIIAA